MGGSYIENGTAAVDSKKACWEGLWKVSGLAIGAVNAVKKSHVLIGGIETVGRHLIEKVPFSISIPVIWQLEIAHSALTCAMLGKINAIIEQGIVIQRVIATQRVCKLEIQPNSSVISCLSEFRSQSD